MAEEIDESRPESARRAVEQWETDGGARESDRPMVSASDAIPGQVARDHTGVQRSKR